MGNNHKPKTQPIAYSEMYKITFDGYNSVGKTSIIRKYLEGKLFNQSQASYIVHSYFIYSFGFPIEEEILAFKYLIAKLMVILEVLHLLYVEELMFLFLYMISLINQLLLQLKKICQYIKINLRKKML